jgi:hypothetical protein
VKVPRSYEGRLVALKWVDPVDGDRLEIDKAPTGMKALASWIEYGKIDDISEGVVRIRHAEAFDAGSSEPSEAMFGYVHEALIIDITLLEPVKEN